jgi:SNF2 family DNA or RNA helicase
VKNRYPGDCDVCRTRVAAQAGETRKINGKWRVFCAAHLAAPKAPQAPQAQATALPVPAGIALFAHQREGIEWLRARGAQGKGALLADDMGLGKTAQTLLSLPAKAPVLVVCPAVAKTVWVRETAKFAPSYAAGTLNGRGSFRWPESGEVLAVNFDILPKPTKGGNGFATLPAELMRTMPNGLVVVIDEAHKCKNAKAQRTKALRAITYAARKEKNGRVVLLTGTPLLNKPQEVWSILVAGGMQYEAFGGLCGFGGDVYRSAMRAAGGWEGRFGWEFSPNDVQPAFAESLAKVMLRRRKTDVLDLPPVREETIEVAIDLTVTERRALDGLNVKEIKTLRHPRIAGAGRGL